MTPPTQVLAWVELYVRVLVDRNGLRFGTLLPDHDAAMIVADWDASCPQQAPHTVRQLAEVVEVVSVDDAMVEREGRNMFLRSWKLIGIDEKTAEEAWQSADADARERYRDLFRITAAALGAQGA